MESRVLRPGRVALPRIERRGGASRGASRARVPIEVALSRPEARSEANYLPDLLPPPLQELENPLKSFKIL